MARTLTPQGKYTVSIYPGGKTKTFQVYLDFVHRAYQGTGYRARAPQSTGRLIFLPFIELGSSQTFARDDWKLSLNSHNFCT